MSKIEKSSPVFVSRVRVMKADELEKIVGAGSGPAWQGGRYKTTSGVDNQKKEWI
jgi:hypothetical protein